MFNRPSSSKRQERDGLNGLMLCKNQRSLSNKCDNINLTDIGVRLYTCPKRVFSIRPFTTRAAFSLSLHSSSAVIIGVLILLAPLIISLIRGTPCVISKTQS